MKARHHTAAHAPGLRATRALAAAPDRIVLVTVALAVACGATVSLGVFHPWTTLPLAAVLAAVGWLLTPRAEATADEARGAGFALLGAAAWVLANLPWIAEYVVVRRDPGFLTLSGIWLMSHGSTDIPTGGAIEAANAGALTLADASQAWNLDGDVLQPQGAKLLPALIAVGGWAGGISGVFVANLVIGAIGLLAVYVVARRFLGPIAALVPAVGVAMTISHIWLSRAAYTEPITMLLLLAAVAWAWRGVTEGRIAPLVLAALASGATMYARIDGAVYAAGLTAGVALAVLASTERTAAWRGRALLTFGALQGLVVAGGYLSLTRWSKKYVERLGSEASTSGKGYAAVIGAVVLASLVLLVIAALRRLRGRTAETTASRKGWWFRSFPVWAASLVAAAWVLLAIRPLLYTSHGFAQDKFHATYVAWMQGNQGLAVDGSRDYAESTMQWMAVYLTWPLVFLGAAGFAVAAYRFARGHREWAIPLAAFMLPGLLYLMRPAIVPDQVWAIRRLAPGAVVGLVLMAALAWKAIEKRVREDGRSWRTLRAASSIGYVVALAPVVTWFYSAPADGVPLGVTSALFVPEQSGARQEMAELCDYVDGRPVVLMDSSGGSWYFGTIRVMCDVPVVLVFGPLTSENLGEMAAAFGEEPVVLARSTGGVPWASPPEGPTLESRWNYTASSLGTAPREVVPEDSSWYVGDVGPDGAVTAVRPPADSSPLDEVRD